MSRVNNHNVDLNHQILHHHDQMMQVWQWLHHSVTLDGGEKVTKQGLDSIMKEELGKLRQKLGAERYSKGHFEEAAKMFHDFSTSDKLADFLTLAAYERLVQQQSRM